MAKTAFVDFRAVKAAITMEQVLEHYGILDKFKRGTDSLSGPCPIHRGSNPTQFRVSISKNIWNCFSECKHGGNVLDFVARMEDMSIHAAALKAIDWFNLDLDAMSADSNPEAEKKPEASKTKEHPRPKPVAQLAPVVENTAPNAPLKFRLDKLEREHPYLTKERGLTLETIIDFGVGHCSKGMMADRIAIPIHNAKGDVVAYAGRFIGEPNEDTPKYKLPPGFRKTQELFNIDRAIRESADKPLVKNVIKCLKAGVPKVAIICLDEERLRKISSAVSGSLGAESAARVEYFQPDPFTAYLMTLQPPSPAPSESKVGGYKVKRSAPKLSAPEQKQKEDIANQAMKEAMCRQRKKPPE